MKKEKEPFTFMPLKYDLMFKGFFAKEENKGLLLSLLNNYLDFEIEREEDLELMNTELIPNSFEDKLARLDLRIKIKNGKQVNVEIQVAKQEEILQRLYYYNAKMYTEQVKKGQGYKKISGTISLAFTMFDVFETKEYQNQLCLYHMEGQKRVLDEVMICIIELNKYKNLDENLKNDPWADLLLAQGEEELNKIEERGGIMAEAVRKLKYFSQEEADRYWPEMIEKYEMDMISLKQQYKEEGREEGLEQGIEKGISFGEEKKQREIAFNMLNLGMDFKVISEATGLSVEEIRKLKKQ